MRTFTSSMDYLFAPQQEHYKALELAVKDTGQTELAQKESEIQNRAVGGTQTGMSKTVSIVFGLAVVGLIVLVVLKKKGKI
jgi:hypothetical protein